MQFQLSSHNKLGKKQLNNLTQTSQTHKISRLSNVNNVCIVIRVVWSQIWKGNARMHARNNKKKRMSWADYKRIVIEYVIQLILHLRLYTLEKKMTKGLKNLLTKLVEKKKLNISNQIVLVSSRLNKCGNCSKNRFRNNHVLLS